MADGSHFARERLTAFTPWHLDAVSGSHPPHLLTGVKRKSSVRRKTDANDPEPTISRFLDFGLVTGQREFQDQL
jgi:hypothetical protein